MDQLINQSINQSVNQPMNRAITQSNQSVTCLGEEGALGQGLQRGAVLRLGLRGSVVAMMGMCMCGGGFRERRGLATTTRVTRCVVIIFLRTHCPATTMYHNIYQCLPPYLKHRAFISLHNTWCLIHRTWSMERMMSLASVDRGTSSGKE